MTDPTHRLASAIRQVHAEDVAAAGELLQSAVTAAQARWVPMDAVIDALALLLARTTAQAASAGRAAGLLEDLAARLKTLPPRGFDA